MEVYNQVSQSAAEMITKSYSTSFTMASKLFSEEVRKHIFNIYGLVRIADEIVDSYAGSDAEVLLNNLEQEVYRSLKSNYSTNMIVHAFMLTANEHSIDASLIKPFFNSMRTDLTRKIFNEKQYRDYVYGSAEVIGQMCLKVFCPSKQKYKKLSAGAQALGAAFQKINFLRDFADDYNRLGRCYFPNTTFETFDELAKANVIKDIYHDLELANQAVKQLPRSSQPAVSLAMHYYSMLLKKLDKIPVKEIKQRRIRIKDSLKIALYARGWIARQLSRGQQ